MNLFKTIYLEIIELHLVIIVSWVSFFSFQREKGKNL